MLPAMQAPTLVGVEALSEPPKVVTFNNSDLKRYGEVTSGGRQQQNLWRQWIALNKNELSWIALVIGGLLILRLI
jgi:hypothetical protein